LARLVAIDMSGGVMRFQTVLLVAAATMLSACGGKPSFVWWSSWRPSDAYVAKADAALDRFQADPRYASTGFGPRAAYHRLYYGVVEHGEPTIHVLLSAQRVRPLVPNTHYRTRNQPPPSPSACPRYSVTYRLINDAVSEELCLSEMAR